MRSKDKSAHRALKDIYENIILAQHFVAGIDCEIFIGNKEKIYAVIRCLEIISEASRRLPEEVYQRHPGIVWPDIAAAGNVYRHEYEAVQEIEIWNTVLVDLPPLLAVVESELKLLPTQEAAQ